MSDQLRGVLLQRPELIQLGVTDATIGSKRRAGHLQVVRRGRYVEPVEFVDLAERDRHALEVRAALSRVKPGARAAKESASLLLGGQAFGIRQVVQLVRDNGRPAKYPSLHVDRAQLPDHHCADVDDIPVTGAPRTVIDMGRTRPLPEALVVADSLLRIAKCENAALRSVLEECALWPGARAARLVVEHADPRAETPFESYSRGVMIVYGVELPELQVWLKGADGRWYRADFYWRRQRLIGEADGRIKYKTGSDLLEEKRRQESLSQSGQNFIRWDWPEPVHQPADFAHRLRRRITELSYSAG